MTPTVEEIVKGLSEAQRRELLHYNRVNENLAFIRLYTVKQHCRRRVEPSFALLASGLTTMRTPLCRIASLTPLGLSVRTYLESMGDG